MTSPVTVIFYITKFDMLVFVSLGVVEFAMGLKV